MRLDTCKNVLKCDNTNQIFSINDMSKIQVDMHLSDNQTRRLASHIRIRSNNRKTVEPHLKESVVERKRLLDPFFTLSSVDFVRKDRARDNYIPDPHVLTYCNDVDGFIQHISNLTAVWRVWCEDLCWRRWWINKSLHRCNETIEFASTYKYHMPHVHVAVSHITKAMLRIVWRIVMCVKSSLLESAQKSRRITKTSSKSGYICSLLELTRWIENL